MNVNGKITIFANQNQGFDGSTKLRFSTSIGHENEDGRYINKYIRVQFAKAYEDNTKKLKENVRYVFDVKEGWLDAYSYTDKENVEHKDVYLFINKCDFVSEEKIGNIKDSWNK